MSPCLPHEYNYVNSGFRTWLMANGNKWKWIKRGITCRFVSTCPTAHRDESGCTSCYRQGPASNPAGKNKRHLQGRCDINDCSRASASTNPPSSGRSRPSRPRSRAPCRTAESPPRSASGCRTAATDAHTTASKIINNSLNYIKFNENDFLNF